MDKNTTTGLILIGAVMVAFFMLNRTPEQPKEDPIVQNTKEEVVEKVDANNLVDSEVSIDTVKHEISQEGRGSGHPQQGLPRSEGRTPPPADPSEQGPRA